MEWYFRNEEDLVVPKDQEQLLDMLPSPDSWSQWGVAATESSQKKQHLTNKSFYEDEEEEEEVEDSRDEQNEYQLNDIAGGIQMNDIFFRSMLEEDNRSTYSHLESSSNLSAKANYNNMMMSAGNYMTSDINGEMEYMNTGIGSSRFSPSVDWDNGDVATSCVQLRMARGCVSSFMEKEKSPEETVLQELERVTSQLTEQTRTCFRDALYRLAENSKQQTLNSNQNVEEDEDLMMDDDKTLRSGSNESLEAKTNGIDRAIAHLMFKKMEDFSVDELSAGSSVNFDIEQESDVINATNWPFKYHQNQTILSDDAQVPIFNQDQENRDRDFLAATAFSNMSTCC